MTNVTLCAIHSKPTRPLTINFSNATEQVCASGLSWPAEAPERNGVHQGFTGAEGRPSLGQQFALSPPHTSLPLLRKSAAWD